MNNSNQFAVIWPERRVIDEKTLEAWFSDAEANGQLCDITLYDIAQERRGPTHQEMVELLSDAGLVTFARRGGRN